MSTRAQDFKAAVQRERKPKKKAPKPSAMKDRAKNPNKRAAKKATVAKEEHGTKRPTPKATRGSKNRQRSDTGPVLRQEGRARSADTRARNAKVKDKHPRGKPRA